MQIPAGVKHLSQEGVLAWEEYNQSWIGGPLDWDAAEVERLVGRYGPLIKEVNLL